MNVEKVYRVCCGESAVKKKNWMGSLDLLYRGAVQPTPLDAGGGLCNGTRNEELTTRRLTVQQHGLSNSGQHPCSD